MRKKKSSERWTPESHRTSVSRRQLILARFWDPIQMAVTTAMYEFSSTFCRNQRFRRGFFFKKKIFFLPVKKGGSHLLKNDRDKLIYFHSSIHMLCNSFCNLFLFLYFSIVFSTRVYFCFIFEFLSFSSCVFLFSF